MEPVDVRDCTKLSVSGKILGYLPNSGYFEVRCYLDGHRTIVGKSQVDLSDHIGETVSLEYTMLVSNAKHIGKEELIPPRSSPQKVDDVRHCYCFINRMGECCGCDALAHDVKRRRGHYFRCGALSDKSDDPPPYTCGGRAVCSQCGDQWWDFHKCKTKKS